MKSEQEIRAKYSIGAAVSPINDENSTPNLVQTKPNLIDFMSLQSEVENKSIANLKQKHEAEIQQLKEYYESRLEQYENELKHQLNTTKTQYEEMLQDELRKSSMEYNSELSKVIEINQKKDQHINKLIEALEIKDDKDFYNSAPDRIPTFRANDRYDFTF